MDNAGVEPGLEVEVGSSSRIRIACGIRGRVYYILVWAMISPSSFLHIYEDCSWKREGTYTALELKGLGVGDIVGLEFYRAGI